MPKKKPTTESKWVDPDEAPHLSREWFETAELWDGDRLLRTAAPSGALGEGTVTLWLDSDVLAFFQVGGPGWHARINQALRQAAGLQPSTDNALGNTKKSAAE